MWWAGNTSTVSGCARFPVCSPSVVIWRNGNALRWARLAVGWVTAFTQLKYLAMQLATQANSAWPSLSGQALWVLAVKVKVKVHTLDIAPLRSESPPQKRSGMARVLKGFHSFTCTLIRNRNEPYLPLPSQPQRWLRLPLGKKRLSVAIKTISVYWSSWLKALAVKLSRPSGWIIWYLSWG